MMPTPRAETDVARKMRLMGEELERLRAVVDSIGPPQTVVVESAEVPQAVIFAAQLLSRYQDVSLATTREHPYSGVSRTEARDAMPEELMAVGSACQLLTDYFDRHNHRLTTARRTKRRHK